MSNYFPKLCSHFDGKLKAELDLCNYAVKSDVKKQQVLIDQHFPNKLI